MIHAFAYILFILPFTMFVGHELKRTYNLKMHWLWLTGAFLTGVMGTILSNMFDGISGNFLLHASGGVASTLLYIYLIKTLNLKFTWLLHTLLLFGFVCMLGVLNELAEYVYEMLNLGLMSFDTHDTWRDMVANTTGALIAWLLYSVHYYLYKPKKNKYTPA